MVESGVGDGKIRYREEVSVSSSGDKRVESRDEDKVKTGEQPCYKHSRTQSRQALSSAGGRRGRVGTSYMVIIMYLGTF